jgi:hypothetical protein
MSKVKFDPKALEELGKVYQEAGQNIVESWQAMMKQLAPSVSTFIDAMGKMYEALHSEYIAAGAIYGDTHEGMMRWIRERAEINRLRYE